MIKMFFMLHQPSRISHIIFFAIISFVSQTCFSQENPYTQCAPRNYTCGNTTFTIRYPFSLFGQPRPRYCNYPNYTLHCRQGNLVADPLLPHFHIKYIDYDYLPRFLHIVDEYFDANDVRCPRPSANSIIHSYPLFYANGSEGNPNVVGSILPFNYTQRVQNLTLYTNCSSPPIVEGNNVASRMKKLDCLSSNTASAAYVVRDEGGMVAAGVEGRCSGPARVLSVMRSAAEDLFQNRLGFGEVLRTGFEVGWLLVTKWCKQCESSGGRCGFNETEPLEPLCFCPGGTTLSTCSKSGESDKSRKIMIGVTAAVASALLLGLGLAAFCVCKKERNKLIFTSYNHKTGRKQRKQDLLMLHFRSLASAKDFSSEENRKEDLECVVFDLESIVFATSGFPHANKLGEGGFGPVFKGKLANGQEIAVKRLSNNSGQGLDEFKNEIRVIARLQHRNLVRLLGCCIGEGERMLIYEYMQNRSLDFLIFDETKRQRLDWQKCFNIIMGVARGILYLHEDSRLRIIHRDLKAGNILLDSQMNPKISDFGMARIFGGDQIQENTRRIAGTFGYMSPEYAMNGVISMKSDVFSFGVIVLEVLTGRKNRGYNEKYHQLNLLGHVWKLWKESKSLELIDSSIDIFSDLIPEVLKCIHVGLLCVQERAEDRPTMSSVVLMLGSESPILSQPKQPGFFTSTTETGSSSSKHECFTINEVSLTMLESR